MVRFTFQRLVVSSSLASLVILVIALFIAVTAAADGVSQGYRTSQNNLPAGTLMGVNSKSDQAEPASSGKAYQLLGLVASAPLISLSSGDNQVQIIVSGRSNALVSTINGTVKAGDRITASPINGVGMKATDPGQIVGIAQSDLAASQTTDRTITDKSGHSQSVKIGQIPLQVGVSYYSGDGQGALSAVLPPGIQSLANSVAGNQVSPLRVIIGMLVLIAGFVIVGIMLYSGVRSGMVSLGRNPLAHQRLRRQLLEIIAAAIVILLISVVVWYIIIKI